MSQPHKVSQDSWDIYATLTEVLLYLVFSFVNLRETMKLSLNYPGHLYSESPRLASTIPYLLTPESYDDGDGLHLIVCVHGLDG